MLASDSGRFSLPSGALGVGASRNWLGQLLSCVGFAAGNVLYHVGSFSLAAVQPVTSSRLSRDQEKQFIPSL